MATIDATVGGADANSYVTVAEADTYFDEHLNVSAWSTADTNQARALIMATRRLDQEWYQGEKASTGQALEWPRINATDKDGEEYASNVIPDFLKYATFELALRLLNDDTIDTFADTKLEEFKRAKVGQIEVERDSAFEAGQLPSDVRRYLQHVLRTARYSGRLLHTGGG